MPNNGLQKDRTQKKNVVKTIKTNLFCAKGEGKSETQWQMEMFKALSRRVTAISFCPAFPEAV